VRTLYWLILLSLAVACGGPLMGADEGSLFPDPVATVNGEPISRDAFYVRLLRAAGRDVLTELVEEEIVTQETAKRGITVSDAELDQRVAAEQAPKVAQRRYSQERYRAWLEMYKERLRMQMLKEKLVSEEVTVTTADVERAYNENRNRYPITVPEQRRVSFILLPKDQQTLAEQLRTQLVKQPPKLGELARKHSISATSERGGEYPYYISLSSDPGADERAIFRLEQINDISPVVPTNDGLFIIRLDDIRPQVEHTFAEVEDELRAMIRQQRLLRQYAVWRTEQLKNAKVEVFMRAPESLEGTEPGQPNE
jgi:foldase protein PrsA